MSANADDGAKGEPLGEAPGALSRLLDELARAPERAPGGAWGRPLRPGDVLDGFEILRELGRGGFGAVYEALDRELGRRVALKTLRPGRSRDEWADEALLREAQAAARLSHPGIVTLHEARTCDRGPYLVMELLRGETLESRLARGPMPQAEAVEAALQMARALAHVHGHGLVHRDLKPANVFLGEDGRVKLLDLGLAHLLGGRSSTGGTPAYVAPEQWRGEEVDGRADVFALGAVLFEMLSGRRAFEVKEERSSALDPGSAPALGAKVPRRLARLVARCLSKEPAGRPTAAQAAEELLEIQRGRARPTAIRRVGLILGAGLVAGIAIALVAVRGGMGGRGGSAAPDGRVLVAVADVANETGERDLDVLSGLLVTSLEQSRTLSVMTQARVLDLAIRAGRKDATRVDETIGREVGSANGVRALLLPAIRKLGTTYSLEMRAVDPGRDEHLFTLADRATSKEGLIDLLDRLSERTRSELGEGRGEIDAARVQLGQAMTRSLEAYQHYVAGLEARFRYGLRARALSEYLAALELDPSFAAARGQLAAVFHTYGRADLFVEHWREAERGIDRMPVKERTILQLQRSFDVDAIAGWSREDALRLAREIEARFPDDKFALLFAAGAHDNFDLPADAERILRKVLDLDPGYFVAASLLAERLAAAEALDVARRAVATNRSPANLWVLAEALRVAGDDVRSRSTAREVLRQDGARNSFITQAACDALHQTGSDEECLAHWRRMAADGQNEYERDFARFKLMDMLAFRGRIREALAIPGAGVDGARASSPHYPGRFSTRPGMLAAILVIGRPRHAAPQAVEHARRITHPQYRRNWLAFMGAWEEAEAIDRTLEGKGFSVVDDVYRYYGLVREGRLEEAVDLARRLGEVVRRKNIVTSLYGIPVLEAEALLAAGRTAEAAEVRPAAVPCRCSDPLDYASNYPRLALLRARAMEQLGRRGDAIHELDGVLAFWKEADRDLPLLVEAKAMRGRLAAPPEGRQVRPRGGARHRPARGRGRRGPCGGRGTPGARRGAVDDPCAGHRGEAAP